MAALPPPVGTGSPVPAPPAPRKLSTGARYQLAMEAADAARTKLAALALDGAAVGELANQLTEVARLELAVSVADHRHTLTARLANAALRRLA